MIRHLMLSLALVSATAASAKPATKADKAAILGWARETLVDPYSLRSTGISDVTEVKGVPVVCIEFNPRNNAGGYEGLMRTTFVATPTGLVHGSQARAGTDTGTCYDPAITLRPFPELMAIK